MRLHKTISLYKVVIETLLEFYVPPPNTAEGKLIEDETFKTPQIRGAVKIRMFRSNDNLPQTLTDSGMDP